MNVPRITNQQWVQVVEMVGEIVQRELRIAFELDCSDDNGTAAINTNCEGIVGRVAGGRGSQDNVLGAGHAKGTQQRPRIAVGLFDNAGANGVEVVWQCDMPGDSSFRLDTFEELAVFLVLHEVGHLQHGESELKANTFAVEHHQLILEKLLESAS